MDRPTLAEYIAKNNGELGEPFLQVMNVIADVAVTIDGKLSRNGLIEEQGLTGGKNVYGEDVEKLDEYANNTITSALLACPAVFAVGSEELEEPKLSGHDGSYNITHDPLDGSKNIDTNLPIGTIFGIYPKHDTVLQKGSSLIASGYVLYGPSLMLVLATKGMVNGFTFDSEKQAFAMSHPNLRIGDKKIYSVNEGNRELFFPGDKAYLEFVKKDAAYSLRYVGSMVGDVHRTLLKGGLFFYPADTKHEHGKLRLLYEVAPIGFLVVQAGGKAVSNGIDALDLMPEKHDQRVPIALGTATEVDIYLTYQKGN